MIYKKTPGLPHLLEHDHALRGGGLYISAQHKHIKPVEEKLVKDRRNIAIRNLSIFSVIIVILIIATIVWRNWGDKNEERRIAITKDEYEGLKEGIEAL